MLEEALIPCAGNLRRRAFEAARTARQGDLPRGWVRQKDWRGQTYYFDRLTWTSSYTEPRCRELYPTKSNRTLVLVPTDHLDSTLECLLVPVPLSGVTVVGKRLRIIGGFASYLTPEWYRRFLFDRLYAAGLSDASSYCWGQETNRREITVNGHSLRASANLVAALRQLLTNAGGKEPVMIWADALCINQQDHEEKAWHVPAMKHIYSCAPVVHMWLGKDTGIEVAVQTLAELSNGKTIDNVLSEMADPAARVELRQSLDILAEAPYWKRKWIIQEATLPAKVVLHAGPIHTHAENIMILISRWKILDEALSTEKQKYGSWRKATHVFWAGWALRTNFKEAQEFDHIGRLRNSYATIPLDSVYGLLGMLEHIIKMQPDYSLSSADVLADATFQLMKAAQSAELVLQACPSSGQLPSWVVDFSKPRGAELDFGGLTRYNASASTKFAATLLPDGRLLTRAILAERIRAVYGKPSATDVSLAQEDAVSNSSRLREWADFCTQHSAGRDWCKLVKWLVQAFDHDPDFDPTWNLAPSPGAIKDPCALPTDRQINFISQRLRKSDRLFLDTHKLFVTERGCVGWVHKDAAISSKSIVTILASCRVPVCVHRRPEHDRNGVLALQLTGPCWITSLNVLGGDLVRKIARNRHGGDDNAAFRDVLLV